jgi:hypothetical protein
MITSSDRGHKTYFDGNNWRYVDNNKIDKDKRSCKRCGKKPTKEGHDACLGKIKGASSACCGHGIHKKIIIKEE